MCPDRVNKNLLPLLRRACQGWQSPHGHHEGSLQSDSRFAADIEAEGLRAEPAWVSPAMPCGEENGQLQLPAWAGQGPRAADLRRRRCHRWFEWRLQGLSRRGP